MNSGQTSGLVLSCIEADFRCRWMRHPIYISTGARQASVGFHFACRWMRHPISISTGASLQTLHIFDHPARRWSVCILRVAGCDTQFLFRQAPRSADFRLSQFLRGGQFRQNGWHNCCKRLGDFLLRNEIGTTVQYNFI